MATGLAAALNYVLGFLATKTYYNLEIWLSIPGTTLFYCIINIFGYVTLDVKVKSIHALRKMIQIKFKQ